MKTRDLIRGYWVYKNILHNEKDDPKSDNYEEDNNDDYENEDEERQETIEQIMYEYGVDEDEAEEILNNS